MFRIPSSVVAKVVEPLWDLRRRSVRLKTARSLRESQWWPPERMAELRRIRLKALLAHAAAHSAFFTDRLQESGIDAEKVDSIEDLRSLPLLTKDEVRDNLDQILSRRFEKKQLVQAKTGGSTGVPLEVFCDPRAAQMRGGSALRSNEWSGWRLGQPIAAVWGNPEIDPSLAGRLKNLIRERTFYLDTVRLTEDAVDTFIAQWHQYRPGMLFGHAHSLFVLAQALADRRTRLRTQGIVSTSMMLIEPERSLIEEVFGVPVTNRYGCEEVSLIACECERHEGLHVNAEHCIVEILDEDGRPCPPGRNGRIVVTELVNHGMPMIRYEVGDMGIWSEDPCSCGRSLPILAKVTGRTADFLVATDGTRVSGISLIENTLTALPGLRQMQIVQEAEGSARVNLVPGKDYDQAVADELVRILQKYLGGDFAIEIAACEEIPREKNGKYRFSICRLT
jgi:phenylacetate-CoA ligase